MLGSLGSLGSLAGDRWGICGKLGMGIHWGKLWEGTGRKPREGRKPRKQGKLCHIMEGITTALYIVV